MITHSAQLSPLGFTNPIKLEFLKVHSAKELHHTLTWDWGVPAVACKIVAWVGVGGTRCSVSCMGWAQKWPSWEQNPDDQSGGPGPLQGEVQAFPSGFLAQTFLPLEWSGSTEHMLPYGWVLPEQPEVSLRGSQRPLIIPVVTLLMNWYWLADWTEPSKIGCIDGWMLPWTEYLQSLG